MKREAFTTALIFLWALFFTHLVRGATLAEFMGDYDTSLIYWAAGLSVAGGSIRTILSLQDDDRIIVEKFKESMWDTLKALVAGLFAFFVVQAIRSYGYTVPNEIRFGAVVAAGWSRMAAIAWMVGVFNAVVASKIPVSIYVDGQKPKDKP